MKISFYDTFIVQNFKNSHFTPNNNKGIVLKNRVQNGLESAFTILLSCKTFNNSHFTPNNYKGIVLKIGVQNQRKSAFTILLSSKTLKTLIFPQIIIRESY